MRCFLLLFPSYGSRQKRDGEGERGEGGGVEGGRGGDSFCAARFEVVKRQSRPQREGTNLGVFVPLWSLVSAISGVQGHRNRKSRCAKQRTTWTGLSLAPLH